MELHTWLAFFAASWAISISPGAGAVAAMSSGLTHGFRRGYWTTIGLILGTFTLTVTGVRLLMPLVAHRIEGVKVLGGAMLGTALVFAAYPLAANPWLMAVCATLLGLTLGVAQPIIMTTLHQVTPEGRHGEALAFRSMAINASSTLMPLVFGALGSAAGAAVLFWSVGGLVGSGAWLTRRIARIRT